LPVVSTAVYISALQALHREPGAGPAFCITYHSNNISDCAAAEASAKRQAFIQALARQAARELASKVLKRRDD